VKLGREWGRRDDLGFLEEKTEGNRGKGGKGFGTYERRVMIQQKSGVAKGERSQYQKDTRSSLDGGATRGIREFDKDIRGQKKNGKMQA